MTRIYPDKTKVIVRVYNRTSFAVRVTFDFSNGTDFTKEIVGRTEVDVPIEITGSRGPLTLGIGATYKPGFDNWKPVWATPVSRNLQGLQDGARLRLAIETHGFNPPELGWE